MGREAASHASESRDAARPRLVEQLATRRFYFVTGKGGVGKTTVSAALALALEARGKRVLVCLCNAEERLSAVLGTRPLGEGIVHLSRGIDAVNLRPERALEEYGRMVLKVGKVADAVFDNRYTKAFFRAVPGLFEWAMLGKAWWHTTETLASGANKYDVVLLDAPATGHGLDMLRVPKVILDVVPPGVLRHDAERAWDMFRDPERSGVLVVTLPEEMPTTETIELSTAVHRELHLPISTLFVNCRLEPLFSQAERDALLADASLLGVDAPIGARGGRAALVAAARRAAREKIQEASLAKLERDLVAPLRADGAPLRLETLPFLTELASTVKGTHALADELGAR